MSLYTQLFTFGAAFLGSAVESTEALTIVLAVGLTRGWRSPLYGTVAALAALAVLVLLFGQLIVQRVPETSLKLIIGTLLLLFGLRWLHKAVLRSAGVLAMHDEERAYQQTVNELQGALARQDWVGFVIAFKGVFLEGIEVVFIVVAVGGTSRYFPEAVAGGLLAMLVVAAAGVVVRKPLARVPENTLKYAVGIILTSLGTFWTAEGMGAKWPLDIVSILFLVAVYLGASQLAVQLVRRRPVLA
jgi:Ca2+/H+ antiporter, TMEM165/GDT1 family